VEVGVQRSADSVSRTFPGQATAAHKPDRATWAPGTRLPILRRTARALLVVPVVLLALAIMRDAAASTSGLAICGSSKSVEVRSARAQKVPVKYKSGLRAARPAAPQSFYKIQLNGSRSCDVSMPGAPVAFYIPAAGDVRIQGPTGEAFWVHLPHSLQRLLRRAAQGLQPFHAPMKLASASVNDQIVAKPSSYLRLYTLGTPVQSAPGGIKWLQISLMGPSSPWTDGWNSLRISRRGDYLKRDGELVRIPASIAQLIRRAKSIPR
jgi:hypothetical protein